MQEFSIGTATLCLADCIDYMRSSTHRGSVRLVYADPPYNIGQPYAGHSDSMPEGEFRDLVRAWIAESVQMLAPGGAIVYYMHYSKTDFVTVPYRELGLEMRNEIIWHYTFGQNQRKKFVPAHTPAFYAVKPGGEATFNADAIRIPSKRQTTYNDKRANPRGKVPDDTFEQPKLAALRRFLEDNHPDVLREVEAMTDVQTFSRVCGTFNERVANVPNQLPVEMVKTHLLALTNPGDLVYDPFAGTGTTLLACLQTGRRGIATEKCGSYFVAIANRLRAALRNA